MLSTNTLMKRELFKVVVKKENYIFCTSTFFLEQKAVG